MTASTATAVSQQTVHATEQFLLDAYHGLVQHARIVRDPHASDRDADEREHNADGVLALAEQIGRLATAVGAGGLLDRLDTEGKAPTYWLNAEPAEGETDMPEPMDGDEYYASIADGGFTQGQLDGENCARCGLWLAEGEPTGDDIEHDGEPLRSHLRCIENAGSEAEQAEESFEDRQVAYRKRLAATSYPVIVHYGPYVREQIHGEACAICFYDFKRGEETERYDARDSDAELYRHVTCQPPATAESEARA